MPFITVYSNYMSQISNILLRKFFTVYFRRFGIIKRLQLVGYDRFTVEEANVNSKCTSINFTLNIPIIKMRAEQIDLLGNTFYINVNEKSKVYIQYTIKLCTYGVQQNILEVIKDFFWGTFRSQIYVKF